MITKIKTQVKKKEFKDIQSNVFDGLQKNQALFSFTQKEEAINYIGKIEKITNKGFYIKLLSHKINWLENSFYKNDSIRVINIDDDYLLSLKIGLKLLKI